MTDIELRKLMSDALPIVDAPESLSERRIRSKIENVTPITVTSFPLRRALAAAAIFLIILSIGFINRNSFFAHPKDSYSQAIVSNNEAPASVEPYPAPDSVPAAGGAVMDTTEENDYFHENAPSESKTDDSAAFSDNVINDTDGRIERISVNEERVLTIPVRFGNDVQICYYDEENEVIQQDPCVCAVIEGDRLTLSGMIPGVTLVEISDDSQIYRITVTVLEG